MNGGRTLSSGAAAARMSAWLCGGALLALAPPAFAQTTPETPSANEKADAVEAKEEARDEILVNAHQQYGAVATQIPPETRLNSASIGALGAADLNEVFEDLAPEIRNGRSDAGKAAAEPVVLVNGQRIAGFSSIRDLPPEAVRRIEIFPEKVALEYGYGPDQRVVNVVLRRDYHALTLLGRYTIAPDDWRGVYRGKVDWLKIGENSHWNVDLDYRHVDPIFAGTTLADPSGTPQAAPAHSLAAQNDDLALSGDWNGSVGSVNAELAGHFSLDSLQSRFGLSDDEGALLTAQGSPELIGGPRYRSDQTADAQTSLTLNGKLDTWRWSFVGKLQDTTRLTRTFDTAGGGHFDALQLPSPTLLGSHCGISTTSQCAVTSSRDAGGDFYLNGIFLTLPAGSATAALRTGFDFSGIRGNSIAPGGETVHNRDEGNVQANLDFPITSNAFPLGKLSLGVNGEARQLSDFGTLTTIGSSLTWAPVKAVEILASYRREEQAPTLMQLGEGMLATPDLREFDFLEGTTSMVQRNEGGNPDLQRSTARIGNVRIQVTPLRRVDLQLSADYTIQRTRDPIVDLSATTAAAEAAFPDRFSRNAAGYLTAIAVGPVNLDKRDQQQIRWGLTYSTPFGPEVSPGRNADGTPKPGARDQFQIALYDSWRLQDDVVLRDGMERLNLLGGDIISDAGATPRHELELQTTVSTSTWSADINARWQTPTTVRAGLLSDERLTFSQGITLNARLQISLAHQRWLTHMLPFLSGKLNISADNLLGAHTTVHDANGIVPLAYAEDYLNPTGRTFRITFRKRFR